MTYTTRPYLSIGWVIALIVLVVVVILAFIGQMDNKEALLLGGLALSRLL